MHFFKAIKQNNTSKKVQPCTEYTKKPFCITIYYVNVRAVCRKAFFKLFSKKRSGEDVGEQLNNVIKKEAMPTPASTGEEKYCIMQPVANYLNQFIILSGVNE